MNREEILNCLLDADFGKQWNDEAGKKFRKAVIDLCYGGNKNTLTSYNNPWGTPKAEKVLL